MDFALDSAPRKVLLIDDDPAILAAMKLLLAMARRCAGTQRMVALRPDINPAARPRPITARATNSSENPRA